MELVYVVVVVIILYFIYTNNTHEGLRTKPSNVDAKMYTDEVIRNKNMFKGGSFYKARAGLRKKKEKFFLEFFCCLLLP